MVGVNVEVEGSSLGPEKFRPKRKFEREKKSCQKNFQRKKVFFSSFFDLVRSFFCFLVVVPVGVSLRQSFQDGVNLLGDCHQAELELLSAKGPQIMSIFRQQTVVLLFGKNIY